MAGLACCHCIVTVVRSRGTALMLLAVVALLSSAALTSAMHRIPMIKGRRVPLYAPAIDHGRNLQSGSIFTAPTRGDFYAYFVHLGIGGTVFDMLVDTGSPVTSIPASASLGCPRWFSGNCSGPVAASTYGDGTYWSGHVCDPARVQLSPESAGIETVASFAGIQSDGGFLVENVYSCVPNGPTISLMDGILGASYPLDTSPSPLNQATLIDSFIQSNHLDDIFSMQCCGWNGATLAAGSLTLGGADASHYTGSLMCVSHRARRAWRLGCL